MRFAAPLVVVADGVGGFGGDGMKAHQNAVARRQYFSGRGGPGQAEPARLYYGGHELARRGLRLGLLHRRRHGERRGRRLDGGARPHGPQPQGFLRPLSRRAADGASGWRTPPRRVRRGAGRSRWGCGARSATARALMAVGDAGSMIHPISGEGVGYALESGRLAASWAHEAHARNDFSASRSLRLRAPTQAQEGPRAPLGLRAGQPRAEPDDARAPLQGSARRTRGPPDAAGGFYGRRTRLQPPQTPPHAHAEH